jgi:hypothetical protein
MIYLSATINNPLDIKQWLNGLELTFRKKEIQLINYAKRPIELNYQILISASKTDSMYEICSKIISESGQILIFTNSRRDTEITADFLQQKFKFNRIPDKNTLKEEFIQKISNETLSIPDKIYEMIDFEIGYHHAGLNPIERNIIESAFEHKFIKILICTNTLSAGINLPVRAVILKELMLYEKRKEPNQNSYDKKPIPCNLFHQICGRAGRPDYDDYGFAYILAESKEQVEFVETNYFSRSPQGDLNPVYEQLQSNLLNNLDMLQEIFLLFIYEAKVFNVEKFIEYFQYTLKWQQIKDLGIPIEGYLNLESIDFLILLKTLGKKDYHLCINYFNFYFKIIQYNSKELNLLFACEPKPEKLSELLEIDSFDDNSSSFSIIQNNIQKFQINRQHSLNLILKENERVKCSLCTKNVSQLSSSNESTSLFCFHEYIFFFFLYSIKLNSCFQIKYPENFHIDNLANFPKIKNNIEEIEELVGKIYFSTPILESLLKNRLIRNNLEFDNSYECTELGKICLRCYILPRFAIQLESMLNLMVKSENIYSFSKIISILKKILEDENGKTYPFLEELLELWINETNVESIHRIIIQAYPNSVSYSNDLLSIIDSTIRYFKFIRDFFSKFHPQISRLTIDVDYIRVRYGVKEDLVNWINFNKFEDPKLFRKLISIGVIEPSNLLNFTAEEVNQLSDINIEDYNRLKQFYLTLQKGKKVKKKNRKQP